MRTITALWLLFASVVISPFGMAEENHIEAFYPLLKELRETTCHRGWGPISEGNAQQKQVKVIAAIAQLNGNPNISVEERLKINDAYREAINCAATPSGEWFNN